MNYIVTTYLTTALDPQLRFINGQPKRNIQQQSNDVKYVIDWYISIRKLGLNGIILHDSLSVDFQEQFPKITFIQIPPVPYKTQLYDYRWVLYWEFIHNRKITNIFFTDLSDVRVAQDPFTHSIYKKDFLFCGNVEENGKLVLLGEDKWISTALENSTLLALPGFVQILQSKYVMLNAGTVGGSRKVIYPFLAKMKEVIDEVKYRQVDITVDMSIFNYVVWQYFLEKVYHGWPVNSIFKKYEYDRNDVWFIHK